MRRSLLTLREEALPEGLFAVLARRVRALGAERLRRTYQTNFWFDFARAPSNVVELAISHLRKYLPSRGGLAGAEWWLSRMRTSRVQVDFHQDRDERLALDTGVLVHPTYSSLLFLNRCQGGLLAVTEALPSPDNAALAPDSSDFALASPKPNRYVLFRGDLTHGVLDSINQIPGPWRPREPRLRLAIAINYWSHPPTGVPSFADSTHYRSLARMPKNNFPLYPR